MRKSKNKWKYTKDNFIDLLSAFPGLLLIYLFSNLYLLFILFKFIRGFESLFKILEVIRQRKFQLLTKMGMMFIFVVLYFSILLVYVEQETNLGLGTFHDGLWLTVTTITSVGYGDVTPESYAGKVIAIILMVFGIGISSAVGALFVAWLLKPSQDKIYSQELKIEREEENISKREKKQGAVERKILKKIDNLEKEVKSLKRKKRK